jgi:hypothetical protein
METRHPPGGWTVLELIGAASLIVLAVTVAASLVLAPGTAAAGLGGGLVGAGLKMLLVAAAAT